MVFRNFYLLLAAASLSACTFQSPERTTREEAAIDRNAELIEQQSLILMEQSAKLEVLAAIQEELGTSLADVRETLIQVQELAAYDAAGVPLPSKVLESLPVVEREVGEEDEDLEPQSSRSGTGKAIVGHNEWVWVDLLNQVLKARIDTGVLLSTISAQNIQPFERNGDKWVSFKLTGDESGASYETRLVRYAKGKSTSEKQERLPVVSLTVHLGELIEETEFTLTDKDSAIYPVLLGRNFLRDIALVDVSRKFTYSKKQLMDRIRAIPNQTAQQ